MVVLILRYLSFDRLSCQTAPTIHNLPEASDSQRPSVASSSAVSSVAVVACLLISGCKGTKKATYSHEQFLPKSALRFAKSSNMQESRFKRLLSCMIIVSPDTV